MVYYTFSQGFRPGGFNQNGGSLARLRRRSGVPQYTFRTAYSSDKLTNNEIGWKTEWFDHRLQWNGAVYQENWNDVQIEFFNPGVVGNLFYDTNGQNFRIRGIETSLVARVVSGLTVQYAASWNQSEQTNSPALINNNPEAELRQADHQVCGGRLPGQSNCLEVTNPFGPIGAPSANSPPIQVSVRARYEWVSATTTVRSGRRNSHRHSFTRRAILRFCHGGAINTSSRRFEVPAYSVYNASFGVAKDAWSVQLYSRTSTDSSASTLIQHQSIHHRADAHAAAGASGIVRVQILSATRQSDRPTGPMAAMIANARMYAVSPRAAELWRALLDVLIEAGAAADRLDRASAARYPSRSFGRGATKQRYSCADCPSRAPSRNPSPLPPRYPRPSNSADAPRYWSDLVVRTDSAFHELRDTFGHRIAFTSPDSQSGYGAALSYLAGVERSVSALQRDYCTANHAPRRTHGGPARRRRGGADRCVCIALAAAVPARVDLASARHRQNPSEAHSPVGRITGRIGAHCRTRFSKRIETMQPRRSWSRYCCVASKLPSRAPMRCCERNCWPPRDFGASVRSPR